MGKRPLHPSSSRKEHLDSLQEASSHDHTSCKKPATEASQSSGIQLDRHFEGLCACTCLSWQVRALIEEVAARHSGDMQTLLIHDAERHAGLFPSGSKSPKVGPISVFWTPQHCFYTCLGKRQAMREQRFGGGYQGRAGSIWNAQKGSIWNADFCVPNSSFLALCVASL